MTKDEEELRSLAYKIGWFLGVATLVGLGLAVVIILLMIVLAV